jgi:hypothetical protein
MARTRSSRYRRCSDRVNINAMSDDICQCGLPLAAPDRGRFWFPHDGEPPPPAVRQVARVGEGPALRAAVKADGGWIEIGALVNFYADRTPPMSWQDVGNCWAGGRHPVVPVRFTVD